MQETPVRLGELVEALGQLSLSELGSRLAIKIHGDPGTCVSRLSTLDDQTPEALSFIANPRYQSRLRTTQAAAVFCASDMVSLVPPHTVALEAADPYLAYALASQWWASRVIQDRTVRSSREAAIHPSAVIAQGVRIGPGVTVGPLAVIEEGVSLAGGVHVGAACVLGAGARVGEGTLLHPRVTLAAGCAIGSGGIVHSGVVIGADGFGFAANGHSGWVKIAQLGAVVIGDRVEIGANTCIDRGALDDTVIGDGVKLDNLIQIGHNVRVGDHTAMAGCVGVAGSAVIGARCTLGGGAIVLGHLRLADDVHVSAASVVTRSIDKPGQYSGLFPLDENAVWERNAASLRQLDALRRRLKALEASMPEASASQSPKEPD